MRKMTIPAQIHILGLTYKVIVKPNCPFLGEFRCDNQTIVIEENQSHERVKSTLIHEIMEIICCELNCQERLGNGAIITLEHCPDTGRDAFKHFTDIFTQVMVENCLGAWLEEYPKSNTPSPKAKVKKTSRRVRQ